MIFNQSEEFGNPTWHYHVTGSNIQDIFETLGKDKRLAGYVSATGSAGTIAAGISYALNIRGACRRHRGPAMPDALPVRLRRPPYRGYRRQILGSTTSATPTAIAAIDDEQCMSLFRLFNEPAGQDFLAPRCPKRSSSNCR
ncbi:MAG: hypothetical protein R3C45_13160 [Phycisphaerales bacterium]